MRVLNIIWKYRFFKKLMPSIFIRVTAFLIETKEKIHKRLNSTSNCLIQIKDKKCPSSCLKAP
jgi:hypothetical protein